MHISTSKTTFSQKTFRSRMERIEFSFIVRGRQLGSDFIKRNKSFSFCIDIALIDFISKNNKAVVCRKFNNIFNSLFIHNLTGRISWINDNNNFRFYSSSDSSLIFILKLIFCNIPSFRLIQLIMNFLSLI
jgi:hypothetical protein